LRSSRILFLNKEKPKDAWKLVRSPERYYELSHGAVWAHVNGEVAEKSSISFKLFKDKLKGKLIPQSYEVITKADDEKMTIGWERKLPFAGTTERYQVLEATADGEQTLSYIALKVPGVIGFFTNCFLKSTIEQSFNDLSDGIKVRAEQSAGIVNGRQ